ncbi:AAA family ATPase [Breznakiella homolactica]|uniref:Replication-associated recombination protein A n=1 Tax=Breznakiella homolactica TaxID=2798577 RepID=A0A7T7XJS2_9SPIR|nr:AAA family ATPase [Breznakiella homolactica]QQO07538.1 AAA family ATPase [Breznakiella homolactica]
MSELFSAQGSGPPQGPLADRMRPRTLDDVIGQDHIVGPGRLLRRAIQADRLSSVIFYGPPGTGKTSLARVIANTTRGYFESLNAVLAGIKDIREAIDRSDERQRLYGKRTILFVDEVHRWNKAQQDALLPWVENGTVILVGATTENPFFEVNRALVSRSRIFQLKPLASADLLETALRTLADAERGYGKWKVIFAPGALEHLVEVAGGDARSLLNALELAVETSPQSWPPPEGSEIAVSFEAAEESIQRRAVLYDRDGDYHFDTISAFIKSIRGSDPDAALYWLAKMVRAGEDPSFIFRRMIILAGEDVGMADPNAITVVISCAEAFERIGFPEGNFPLAHAVLYLATAPKSNTAMAFFDALKEVDREDAEVPNHLRDASRDKEGFGHGDGYVYPHAYRDHWAAQQYLPSALRGKAFYIPSVVGYEGKIRDEVLRKRELQAATVLGDTRADGEFLSWSASSKGKEGWFKRLESGRSGLLLSDRDAVINKCPIVRHHRILIPAANDGLLLWEALRRTPEGLTAAMVDSETARDALLRYAAVLDQTEQPEIAVYPGTGLPLPDEAAEWFSSGTFDRILAREPWRKGFGTDTPGEVFSEFALRAKKLLSGEGAVVILKSPPRLGERISRILRSEGSLDEDTAALLREAEDAFFGAAGPAEEADETGGARRWTWEPEDLASAFRTAGFETAVELIDQKEERLLGERDLSLWFDTEKSSWGSFIHKKIGSAAFEKIKKALEERAKQGPILWQWKSALISGSMG